MFEVSNASKKRRLRRIVVLLTVIGFLYYTFFRQVELNNISSIIHGSGGILRPVIPQTPIYFAAKEWERENLGEATLENQCKFLVKQIYKTSPDWSNAKSVKYYDSENVNNYLASFLAESVRIYDHCFIRGGLKLQNIMNPEEGADFNRRMFPFLKFQNERRIYPQIIDLRNARILQIPGHIEKIPVEDYNLNFWNHWAEQSSGKGIVISLAEREIGIFFKLLRVLDTWHNELPIQIVTSGYELGIDSITKIMDFVTNETKQKVFLVNCKGMIDGDFTNEHVKYFMNKWISILFNTFEDAMLIDNDVVPFVSPLHFFDEQSYKERGLLLYKDRNMPQEKTFPYCIEMFKLTVPSNEECNMIGSNLFFNDVIYDTLKENNDESFSAYMNFFTKLHLHNVDSGLVMVNKKKKLSGLIMSFLLHLDSKVQKCIYGDKELFWLGQLFSGHDFAIDQTDTAIIGKYGPKSNNNDMDYICSAQIGHTNDKGQLLWSNGGLKTCKVSNSAVRDWERDGQYFKERYNALEQLETLYNMPLQIEGLLIPNVTANPWMQIKECSNYMYCAFGMLQEIQNGGKIRPGYGIEFSDKDASEKRKIVEVWNKDYEGL